ncbi:MAG TPA: hypothetical protein VJB02_05480 [Coxiellaceae bacterium]|nr:hypothetical protein [Coxiellaceae bacterium]
MSLPRIGFLSMAWVFSVGIAQANEIIFFPEGTRAPYSGSAVQTFCKATKEAVKTSLTFTHEVGATVCSLYRDGKAIAADDGSNNIVTCGVPSQVASGTWQWEEICPYN